ncbi:MAG TPA: fibronectin type III domain-containing protein [Herpetosiphonaceae bacterium]
MLPSKRLTLIVATAVLFVISAVTAGSSAYASQSGSVPLSMAAANPERAPYNLASRALSNTSIRVSWTNSSYIDGFRLYRWNGSSWQVIRERFTNTWYDDKNLTPGTTYHYTVCSYYGSNTVCADGYTSAATTSAAPAAPNALWATPRSSSSIRFGWNQPCWNQPCVAINSFRVFRQRAGTSTVEYLTTVAGNVRTWDDTGLSPSTEYYYTVCADNESGSVCAASWTRGKTY